MDDRVAEVADSYVDACRGVEHRQARLGRRQQRRDLPQDRQAGHNLATEHRALHPLGERADERRLADPRLAADEHKSAALAEGRGKRREQLLTLEQVAHARMFGVSRRAGKCRSVEKIGNATPQSR